MTRRPVVAERCAVLASGITCAVAAATNVRVGNDRATRKLMPPRCHTHTHKKTHLCRQRELQQAALDEQAHERGLHVGRDQGRVEEAADVDVEHDAAPVRLFCVWFECVV